MNPFLRIFLTGLLISFLGSLPLGTMNVVATTITVQYGVKTALLFCLGGVLIEISYVRIALVAMDRVIKHYKIFRVFEWLTVMLILALALGTFLAAGRLSGIGKALPIDVTHPFLLGIVLSATNPLHITFWFGWSTILLDKRILIPKIPFYNIYITGIGIGSLLGYNVFIFGGNYLINKLKVNQNILSWLIGSVLFITAIIQSFRIIRKPLIPLHNL